MVVTFGLDTNFEAFFDQVLVGSVTVSSLTHRGKLVFSFSEICRCWAPV